MPSQYRQFLQHSRSHVFVQQGTNFTITRIHVFNSLTDRTNSSVKGIIDKEVGGDESEVQSLRNKAAEELFIRPKFGETYETVTVDVERIKKLLKDLSMSCGEGETMNKSTIDEGLEISDAVSLLKLKRISSSGIEMAGQKAQRAATWMLQAQMITNKANELLAQSKQILQSANL